jgi:hypothetical protein
LVERFQILGFLNKGCTIHEIRTNDSPRQVRETAKADLISCSVKTRLSSREGIDAASFLYQSLQAYDFLRLYQTKKCKLQVWSNWSTKLTLFTGRRIWPMGKYSCGHWPLSEGRC